MENLEKCNYCGKALTESRKDEDGEIWLECLPCIQRINALPLPKHIEDLMNEIANTLEEFEE